MRISREFEAYNGRRYSKPWVAHITAFDGRPELDFVRGAWNGTDDGGELVFDAEPGEVVKIGQKDGRGNGTQNDFYRVGGDGGLEQLKATEARTEWDAWQASRGSKVSIDISQLAVALVDAKWDDTKITAILEAVKAAGIAAE